MAEPGSADDAQNAAHYFGPSYVRKISPYIAGKPIAEVAREFGLDEARIVKLASNENPLGMPASAKSAIAAAMDELGRYPDSNGFELKARLSAKYDVPAEWLTLGNGSNDIHRSWPPMRWCGRASRSSMPNFRLPSMRSPRRKWARVPSR